MRTAVKSTMTRTGTLKFVAIVLRASKQELQRKKDEVQRLGQLGCQSIRKVLGWRSEEDALAFTKRATISSPNDVKQFLKLCKTQLRDVYEDMKPLPDPADTASLPSWLKPRRQDIKTGFSAALGWKGKLRRFLWAARFYARITFSVHRPRQSKRFQEDTITQSVVRGMSDLKRAQDFAESKVPEYANAGIKSIKKIAPSLQDMAMDRLEIAKAGLAAFLEGYREGKDEEVEKLNLDLQSFHKETIEKEVASIARVSNLGHTNSQLSQPSNQQEQIAPLDKVSDGETFYNDQASGKQSGFDIAFWACQRRRRRRSRKLYRKLGKATLKAFSLDAPFHGARPHEKWAYARRCSRRSRK